MGVVGAAIKGFGKALMKGKKGLRPSKTGAIKSVKPGVGGLKASREMFEDVQKSVAIGVKKFGRPIRLDFYLNKELKKVCQV